MAFVGDGIGNISFTQWDTGVGDFTMTGTFKTPSVFAFEAMMGDTAGSNNILFIDVGNTVKLKISSTITITGMVADTEYPFTIARVGSIVTFTANAQSPTLGFGGTNVPWDLFSGFGPGAASPFSGAFVGVWTFTDDLSVVRTYDFNQPIGTPNLPETTGGFNGTLNGFVTGDYDGAGADSIVITSVSDGDFFNRDNLQNQKLITIAGDNIGTQPTSVEYRLDFGPWIVLDASPTATFTGAVTVTCKQFIQVQGVGADTISPSTTLIVGLSIVAGWQSNEQGYGINTQPVNQGASSPVPLMYDGVNIVTLTDPTATVAGFGGAGGSTWPRIAKKYADEGTIICVYNIGVGGSLISAWQKGGPNYAKIAPFVTKVGGLGLFTTIGGENDAQNGITQIDMETQLTALVTDIDTDFSADSYICKFPMKEPASNVATVFAAYDAVIAANSFAKAGGDLSVIDIEIATAPGNDGVHLKQDADLTQAGDIRFTSQSAGLLPSSTLNIAITGMVAGTFDTVFSANGVEIFRDSATFTTGNLSLVLPVPASTTVKGYVDDASNPSTDGAYLEGITV